MSSISAGESPLILWLINTMKFETLYLETFNWGSKIDFSNPASHRYFSSHPVTPLQWTFPSRFRLVKLKLLKFTVLLKLIDKLQPLQYWWCTLHIMEKVKDMLKRIKLASQNFTYKRTNRKAIKFFSLSHNNKDHISVTTNFVNFREKRASERSDIRFNAYYELILKHTASWGHKQSMHRVREFLERCLPHSKASARESTWTKLIQIYTQKYLQTNRIVMVAKKGAAYSNTFMSKIENQIFDKSANKPLVY